jgi:TrmH family RNA methyltransferase
MTTYRSRQSLITMLQRVQSARGRRAAGLFSIEGTRLVERALRAGAPLEAVLVADSLVDHADPRYAALLEALRSAGCIVMTAPNPVLSELTEGRDLGLMLGLVRRPPPVSLSVLLPGITGLAGGQEALDRRTPLSGAPALPLLLAAVEIVDPGNVGALVRTAHATGAAALLTVGASDPFHPRATRISRGSIFKLPVIEYSATGALLSDLQRQGIALVGTAAGGGTPLAQMVWPRRGAAVLMGNEAEGLPLDVQAALDYNITIPMPAGVDSYSVNAAAAIVLYVAAQAYRN